MSSFKRAVRGPRQEEKGGLTSVQNDSRRYVTEVGSGGSKVALQRLDMHAPLLECNATECVDCRRFSYQDCRMLSL